MNYIVLDTGSASKKFKMVAPWRIRWAKGAKMRTTLGGVDFEMGKLYEIHDIALRVQHTPDDASFGSLSDLKNIYSQNSAISYTDLYSVQHNAVFVGDGMPQPLSTIVEGGCAYFVVKLTLVLLD
jgi:hypothetical protein